MLIVQWRGKLLDQFTRIFVKIKGQRCANTLPTVTSLIGHMSILDECPGEGYKLCRKKLHWYLFDPKRNTKRGCIFCEREASRRWRQNNPKQSKEAKERWDNKNKERKNAASLAWQKANKEKVKQYRQKAIEQRRAYNRQWIKENKDKARIACAKRKAYKLRAIPAWANNEKIKEIYNLASKKTKQTKIKYEVDHVYPLQSDWLCGFHVENNLQIITSCENKSKSNKNWPGQLDCQKGSVYDIFPKELTKLLND